MGFELFELAMLPSFYCYYQHTEVGKLEHLLNDHSEHQIELVIQFQLDSQVLVVMLQARTALGNTRVRDISYWGISNNGSGIQD